MTTSTDTPSTSDRVTRGQVDRLAELVAAMCPDDVGFAVGSRNGYTALDLTRRDGDKWRTVRHLRSGTKREIRDYLYAMREGIYLSRGDG